eukprot:m.68692 g.68692  ORF g.68692 m.68692 type:complete len:366 (-) comp7513_c0_seq1:319-1416(-)
MADQGEAHPLTLKVMRLSKPKLALSMPLLGEPGDWAAAALHDSVASSSTAVRGCELLRLSEAVTLPQSFGTIFLGETFSSFISVHNDSLQDVKDIILKIELRTTAQTVNLTRAEDAVVKSLGAQQSTDLVVHHEVKELGLHTLVCSVQYAGPGGEGKVFRKFFKFSVSKPLDVRTKAYNMEADVFLEAQLQNMMATPIFLQSVTLNPAPGFVVIDLNDRPKAGDPVSFANFLNTNDTRQFLYRLTPKPGSEAAARSAAPATFLYPPLLKAMSFPHPFVLHPLIPEWQRASASSTFCGRCSSVRSAACRRASCPARRPWSATCCPSWTRCLPALCAASRLRSSCPSATSASATSPCASRTARRQTI